ncbi:hypothetical protein EMN47_17600 [Prolixibacteraceae bacterium JC049]|nr:hypothetical protein [Prolixibacteraceae bacterium JC049]
MNSAKSIAIVWIDDKAETTTVARQMMKKLQQQGKKVQEVFFSMDETNEEALNIKDFSWLGAAKSEQAKALEQADFDLLICLSTDLPLPMKQMVALSKAHFKIGWNSELFDMQIATDEVPSPRYLAEQITIYLEMINK